MYDVAIITYSFEVTEVYESVSKWLIKQMEC